MRQLVFCSLLLLTGCTNVVGPFGPRPFAQVDDPRLPIYEQERRGRATLGLNDETYLSGPHSGSVGQQVYGNNK